MKLYHYLIKAVKEYVEDTCPKKMSDEELFEALLYVDRLRSCLVNESDLHVADYLISLIKTEGEKRGGLVFCKITPEGHVSFNCEELRRLFNQLEIKAKRKAVTNVLDSIEKRENKLEKGARGRARLFLMH